MTSKTCTCCRETLPLLAFSIDRNTKDGLRYICRACAVKKQTARNKTRAIKKRSIKDDLNKHAW